VGEHERTGALLGCPLARALEDGDEIELGEGADGRAGGTLRAARSRPPANFAL